MKAPISRYIVHGKSMLPILKENQDVLSVNWFFKVKKGDIVVIKVGDKEMVKRVQNVHDCKVFVEGDNKKQSTDSRDFGAVDLNQIVGKVIYSGEP